MDQWHRSISVKKFILKLIGKLFALLQQQKIKSNSLSDQAKLKGFILDKKTGFLSFQNGKGGRDKGPGA